MNFTERRSSISSCHEGVEICAHTSLILRRLKIALYVYSPDEAGCSVNAVFRLGEEISFGLRNNTVSQDTGPLGVSACGFCNAIVAARLLRSRNPLHSLLRHFPGVADTEKPPETCYKKCCEAPNV